MTSLATDVLEAFLLQQRQASDRAIERTLQLIPADSRIGDAMRYALVGSGKRLRPALCAAGYESVARREADDRIADLGCAVELIHTYSLVHDDLPCMDNDDVRRGRATTHRVFGPAVATLAGAALIPLAFRVAHQACSALLLDDARRRGIIRALAQAAGAAGMVGGQVMDLTGRSASTSLEDLERTHAAKTGALLAGACRIGAMAARADRDQLRALDNYASHVGLAFQITDDVLDETASTEELGKTAGKDRAFDKATFPSLLGVAGAAERAITEANAATAALNAADLAVATLAVLARFAVERKR